MEVQLYVSPDRGVRWDNWRQATPQKGFFLFRAGCDGEYWFDVRTRDRSGRVRPEGPHTPKLIVIVDTSPPKVQLTATRGDAGQITAAFRIDEPYPKLESLVIEYRLGPNAAWQTVLAGPKDVHSTNAEHRGEVTWYPQPAWGTMEVRLRVSDMAGNPAESHTQVALPSAATNPVRPPLGTAPPTAAAATIATSQAPPPPAGAWKPQTPEPGRTPWPAENSNTTAFAAANSPATPSSSATGSVSLRVPPSITEQFVGDRPQQPAAPANPFTGFTTGPSAVATAKPAGEVGPPPGVKLRWINTRAFQLTYDTRTVNGSTNVPVELWGTRDGGKSWQSFGKDAKGQSPMLVTVPEDGIYGFRMTMENDPRIAGRPPLAGEQPGIWIGIDLIRPTGRIRSAQQGAGRDGDKLFIAWEASDNRDLAAGPIALSYSERPGGPWTSMVSGLENTGRYAWQLTGSLPPRIYLRLEVHDAAGNLGVYEMPEPVTLDLSSPAAQLRDLRPMGHLDSQPATQYMR